MATRKKLLDDPSSQFLVGLGLAVAAGHAAKKVYDGLSASEKRNWRKKLPHHGEVGLLALAAGLASGNPVVTGAGLGAVVTDLNDNDEWFRETQ